MDSNYNEIKKIIDNGYSLDLGRVIEKSFETYKKIVGIAGISMMILSIVLAVLFGGLYGAIAGFSNFSETMANFKSGLLSTSTQLTIMATSAVFAAIFSPINAGFLRMSQLASLDQKFGIDTVFEYFKTHHFKDLFISALIISLLGNVLSFLLTYFGLPFIGSLMVIAITFFTILYIPLIIFSNLNAMEAITMSFSLVIKNPLIIAASLLLGIIFAAFGFIALCIGIFFTLPFYYVVHYTIYSEIVPLSVKTSELDEIGLSS